MARARKRWVGHALMGAAVVAFFARAASCTYALSHFTPDDPVSYAKFDYHGVGSLTGWITALLFFYPILWLGGEAFMGDGRPADGAGARARGSHAICSIVIAACIAAPTVVQIAYVRLLPISIAWPVLASSLSWVVIVEIARRWACARGPLSRAFVRTAIIVAGLSIAGKTALIAGVSS